MEKSKLFHIVDKADMNYLQMLSYARKYKHKYGIGLIFVDYLQLIKPVSKKSIREQEVAEVSRSLKEIAKDLECSVIALVQLNRETEKENRPPRASDIRESGSIEQDADYIIMLSRVVKDTRQSQEEKKRLPPTIYPTAQA
ncbi:MAG: DnaB-like helicase C-terminal domain-containing protein [Bacilli bacterium]